MLRAALTELRNPSTRAAVPGFDHLSTPRLGISHELTLADDSGSGRLRAWYETLDFVDASGFMDTAMFARTGL